MGKVCRGTTPGKDLVPHLTGGATHEDVPHVLSLLVAKDAPVGMGEAPTGKAVCSAASVPKGEPDEDLNTQRYPRLSREVPMRGLRGTQQ